MKLYVESTHLNRLIEAILMSTYNLSLLNRRSKKPPLASWLGAMINPQWLELLISRINVHDPKDDRAIEVLL